MTQPLSQTSPLQALLYDLEYRAQNEPEMPHCIQFENGLQVDVVFHGGQIHLKVSREHEFPSIEEYEDILNFWPYAPYQEEPKAFIHDGRKYLTSSWWAMSMPTF